MLAPVIFVVLIVILLSLVFYYDSKSRKVCMNIPGPDPLPFIGNAHQCIGTPADVFEALNMCWQTYGLRIKIHIGPQLILILSDPNDVEVILNKQEFIEKAFEYNFLQPWLGTGLLTSTGEKWKKHRKIITPAFHFKILENFLQVFNSQTDILTEKLKAIAIGGQFVNIYPIITLFALDTIAETAMGVSINAQKDADSDYIQSIKVLCEILQERMKNPLKRFDFLFALTRDYWKQKKALKTLHDFTNKMIQKRRQLLNNNKETLDSYISDESENIYGRKKKLAFLDMLLLSKIDGKPLTNIEIREEVDTFLFEGHDTTTSALSFALYCFAKNPQIQQKLYEEQISIFGENKEASPTYSELQDMKYLEMAIKEALRLYPSVPLLGRITRHDTQINDIEVPAGTTVAVSVYNMNRNPDVFPDPEEFIPERFAVEESAKRNPFSNVSFSAGPRNCIGQKFAMMEMKVTLSKIIRLFELIPSKTKLILRCDIILREDNGIYIKLKSRK